MKCSRYVFFLKRSPIIKVVHSVIFLLFMVLSIPFTVYGAIPASERAALIALYESTDGDNWTYNSGWKTGDLDTDGFAMPGTEDTWYGITVTSDTSDNVTEITLNENNLVGTIPVELDDLANLAVLDLGINLISGPIPSALGNLANLVDIFLDSNQLTGSIPTELGGLTNLVNLGLTENLLTGPIPTELGNLTNLVNLGLGENQLTGPIPTELENLTNLEALLLGNNQLTGSIPPELENLTNLLYFGLHANQLTGPIPPELGGMTNLVSLWLWGNDLSGSIPPELGDLTNLFSLWISGPNLTGSIPSEIGNLTNLFHLALVNTQITGPIPAELGDLTNLGLLGLGNNNLTGPIPPSFGNLTNLTFLSLLGNQLEGSIPSEMGDLILLETLNLYDNQLTGPIPSQISNLTNLQELHLWGNALSGEIPSGLSNLINLTGLTLGYNALYTDNATLFSFIDNLDPDWELSQTVAPAGVITGEVTENSVVIRWNTISFTETSGGYRVSYSTNSGGPYTYYGITNDKQSNEMTVNGLSSDTTHYFVVQAQTDPHQYNQNTVTSGYSDEISAKTEGGDGGGSSGIFGTINSSDLMGYHMDWTRRDGIKVYMPVTKWIKALKGAQTHVEGFAPDLADFVRENFDALEKIAKKDPDGLLSRIGTAAFPLLGKAAEIYLDAVDSRELMDKAYINTTIGIKEFDKFHKQGTAVSSHVVEKNQ